MDVCVSRLVFHCLPVLRCRLVLATTLLGLLSLVAMPLLLHMPARSPSPFSLPGMPLSLAVDTASHDVILTTATADAVLTLDGAGDTVLGGAPFASYGVAVAVDPILGHVYVATPASRLVVLATPIPTPLATIDLDTVQVPVALAVNPTSGHVYAATRGIRGDSIPGDLVVLDGLRETVTAEVPLGHGFPRVAVDPAINRVYVTDDASDTITALDGATNATIGTLALGRGPHDLAVNPGTGRVYVSNGADHSVSVLDGPRLHLLATVAVVGSPGPVAVNERTNRAYVATDTGSVAELDGTTYRLLATVPVAPRPTGLAVDATTSRVYVTSSFDGTVWLLQDGRFGHPNVRLAARVNPETRPSGQERDKCGCLGGAGE